MLRPFGDAAEAGHDNSFLVGWPASAKLYADVIENCVYADNPTDDASLRNAIRANKDAHEMLGNHAPFKAWLETVDVALRKERDAERQPPAAQAERSSTKAAANGGGAPIKKKTATEQKAVALLAESEESLKKYKQLADNHVNSGCRFILEPRGQGGIVKLSWVVVRNLG